MALAVLRTTAVDSGREGSRRELPRCEYRGSALGLRVRDPALQHMEQELHAGGDEPLRTAHRAKRGVVTRSGCCQVACVCVVAWLAGCGRGGFICSSSSECVQGEVEGLCEADGWCSFPDPDCASGARYGANSGDGLAGKCTPVGEDMTSGAPTSGTAASSTAGTVGPTTEPPATSATADSSEVSSGVVSVTAGETEAESSSSDTQTSGTGEVAQCPESLDACDGWFLPIDAMEWEPARIAGPAALRPDDPVLLAFDIEAEQRGFVLTSSEVCTFDLETRTWLEKRLLSDVFPDTVGEELLGATSIPASWPPVGDEKVRLTTAEVQFLFAHNDVSDTFVLESVTGVTSDEPNAPAAAALQARWFSTDNGPGWAEGSPDQLCGAATDIVTTYGASIADGAVYVRDLDQCFSNFPPEDYAVTLPTSYAGAPPVSTVAGAIYNEATGLVLLVDPTR